jgi:dynein light intermediate chain, axonemal
MIQAEDGRASMEDKIEKLAQVEQQLQHKIDNLQVELERNARRAQEDIEALKKQHAEEVEFLQRSNQQLKVHISINSW